MNACGPHASATPRDLPGLATPTQKRPARVPFVAACLALAAHLALLFGPSLSRPEPIQTPPAQNQGVTISLEALAPPPEPLPEAPRPDIPAPPVSAPEVAPPPAPLPAPTPPRPRPMAPAPEPPAPATRPAELPSQPAQSTPTAPTQPAAAPPAQQVAEIAPAPSSPVAVRENPKPVYPDLARRRGQEGSVLLRVSVNAEGRPETVNIEESSGHNLLDQAALKAVRAWRFQPARLAGLAVPGEVLVPVEFRLR